jgi:repressor LexA
VNIIPLPSILLRFPASEAFIVKAKGNSMEPKIHNGDLVIARMQNSAEDGDIVVCVYNEQARIKKLFKQNGVVGLESLNKDYKMEIVTGDLKIEGVVKNIHSFK